MALTGLGPFRGCTEELLSSCVPQAQRSTTEHREHDPVAASEIQLPEERQPGEPLPFFWQVCVAEKKVTVLLLLYYNKLSYCSSQPANKGRRGLVDVLGLLLPWVAVQTQCTLTLPATLSPEGERTR